jgi:hypothetical protein
MKNLFKVSALVWGLGLGFSQVADAAIATATPAVGASYTSPVLVNNGDSSIVGLKSAGDFSHTWNLSVNAGESATLDFKNLQFGQFFNITGFNTTSPTASLTSSVAGESYDFSNLLAGNYSFTISGIGTGMGSPLFDNSKGIYSVGLLVSPVPEAEEWAMMMLGLGMMGFVAKRKKAFAA